MVDKIVGIDKTGKKLFERNARDYDKGIMDQIIPGLTLGDIVKAVPIFFIAGVAWTNFNNQYLAQQATNAQLLDTVKTISGQVEKHSRILIHLDNYLSSATGKQFNDGEITR